MPAAPYPYHRWPKIDRRSAMLAHRCAGRLSLDGVRAGTEELSRLLGIDVRIDAGLPETSATLDDAWPSDEARAVAAVVLAAPEGPATHALLELDPPLASRVVDRMLGGEGDAIASMSAGLYDVEKGVLGYVMARLLAANGDDPWHVVGVVTTTRAARAAVRDENGRLFAWPARVRFGGFRGAVRLWLPEPLLERLPAPSSLKVQEWARSLPLELVADAARAAPSAEDLATLRPGDILVMDESWITTTDASSWSGEARVRVQGARRTTWWCTIENAGLRLRAEEHTTEQPTCEGRSMNTDTKSGETDEVLERAGDAPVEVTVELGRFTMTLEELALVRPGAILATGRAVGDRVTLRAGSRAVASGELVDVDGEVGVRVFKLASADGSS